MLLRDRRSCCSSPLSSPIPSSRGRAYSTSTGVGDGCRTSDGCIRRCALRSAFLSPWRAGAARLSGRVRQQHLGRRWEPCRIGRSDGGAAVRRKPADAWSCCSRAVPSSPRCATPLCYSRGVDHGCAHPVGSCDRATVRRLMRVGALFLVLQAAVAVAFQSDVIVAARVVGQDGAAQYSIGFRVFMLVPVMISLVTLPLWPAYGEALARGDRVWIHRTFWLSTFGSLVLTLVSSANSPRTLAPDHRYLARRADDHAGGDVVGPRRLGDVERRL